MSIKINLGAWNSIFAVPTDVVDKHLKFASAIHLKVLLYILRHSNEDISLDTLCSALNQSSADINDALAFWVEVGLLNSTKDNFEIPKTVTTSNPTPSKTPYCAQPSKPLVLDDATERIKTITNQIHKPSQQEISKLALANPKIALLLQQSQDVFGRPLSPSETSTIVSFVDYYAVEPEIILMIIAGCKILGKLNANYIEKVISTCIDKEITAHDDVDKFMNHLISAKNNENIVKSAFGITNRGLTEKQKQFISSWFNELGYGIDIIKMAYDKAIDTKDTSSFNYINTILQNWYKDGVKTKEDVANLKPPKSNTKYNKNNKTKETSYDIDEYYKFVEQDSTKIDSDEE